LGSILFHEEADDPLPADRAISSRLKLGTRGGLQIERLLFVGNSLDKARAEFAAFARKRTRALFDHPATNAGARGVATARVLTVFAS
jgi:hypothetical protein